MVNTNGSHTINNCRQNEKLDGRSISLRKTIVQILAAAGRGHPAAAMSLVEILRVLYDDILRYDCQNHGWPLRDRFILSKGHGCLALYAILAEKGFFPQEELWKFCKKDGILGGHPEYSTVPGIEASTGSLGHGLPIGIGFALNARLEKIDSRIFVVIGDGESNEGSIWEAALTAAKYQLDNLCVIVDHNKMQSYGPTAEVLSLEPLSDKWRTFGFGVAEVDGHNVGELRERLSALPVEHMKPSAIICHTVKGKGVSCMENNLAWHHKSAVKKEELARIFAELEADYA